MASAGQERRRQTLQDLARTAYNQAFLTGQILDGKKAELWEAFPGVWTDDEVKEMRLARYKLIMQRHAGGEKK
ncbi:MAG: hypothetical protein LUD69_07330 [Oscillospiraceae bacterium]|nr:hypothetical protein [Oscillospiraceae bacterium]